MTQVLQRTLMFADLRGSTSMYETLGNADATAVVTRSIALLATIVATHGGTVVKTLGDGLMAMLPSPAQGASAAEKMHDAGLPTMSADTSCSSVYSSTPRYEPTPPKAVTPLAPATCSGALNVASRLPEALRSTCVSPRRLTV